MPSPSHYLLGLVYYHQWGPQWFSLLTLLLSVRRWYLKTVFINWLSHFPGVRELSSRVFSFALAHWPIHKFQNALVPYPTMLHSEQKCAHFCSEWSIVGYGTGAFWDLWNWSIYMKLLAYQCGGFHWWLTHWGWDKMAAISQTEFSNALFWMKIGVLRFKFHRNLFPKGPINNMPALVQIMPLCQTGNKPLSELN